MTPALNIGLHPCADLQAQAGAVAGTVGTQLRAALAAQGSAVLAVSGGRSPLALFRALRGLQLDWPQVTLVLADERCVAPTHADSNARLVREHLLQGPAAAARFLPFFDALPHACRGTADELEALARQAELRLADACDRLDVLVLGMGEDGHTASLFAGAAGLENALRDAHRVAAVEPPGQSCARLTLTLPVLQRARQAHLVMAGAAKRQTLARAMTQAGDALPVSWVLRRPGAALQVWQAP